MIPKPVKLSTKQAKARAWRAFSLFIRARDGGCVFHYTLKEMGMEPPCRCAGVLQAGHLISRSKGAILFDEQNVIAECSGANTWQHFHEAEWDKLWRGMFSDRVEHLDRMRDVRCQRKVKDYLAIEMWYKRELDKLKGRER